ncbi:MAG: hypothetical protein IKS03_03725 [Ruminococcus sp.]|nr:hypothetical protein [Ruminococcus sp.]
MGDTSLWFLRLVKAIIDLILAGMSQDDAIAKIASENGLSKRSLAEIFDRYKDY